MVLRSWGGFTGKLGEEVRHIDLDHLPPSEAAAIERLLREADFFALPPKLEKALRQPWDFTHELTVRDGGRERTVTFHEAAAPPSLRELVQRLAELGDAGG